MEESKVIDIIAEQLNIAVSELDDETVFEDLGADSLDLFQIVSALEQEFDLEIDGEQAEGLKTVGDVVRFIKVVLEK